VSRSSRHRLLDILDTTHQALLALRDRTPESIEADWLLRHGLQGAIVIIAEAVSTLPAELTASQPQIPWADIVGMGVKIKHHYHRVAPRVLWDTVVQDFPVLHAAVKAMLAENEQSGLPL
jgi:uncharacterized protein with HEPN domain